MSHSIPDTYCTANAGISKLTNGLVRDPNALQGLRHLVSHRHQPEFKRLVRGDKDGTLHEIQRGAHRCLGRYNQLVEVFGHVSARSGGREWVWVGVGRNFSEYDNLFPSTNRTKFTKPILKRKSKPAPG